MQIKKYFLSALAIAGLVTSVSCTKPAVEKNIGLQLYSVRDDMAKDPESTLMELGKMGCKFVEAASYNDGAIYGMSPADFRALVEKNGMKLLGAHIGQPAPDSAHWDSTMMWWDKAIAAHREAGVEWIVQPSMGSEAYESLEGLKKYCDYFNAVGEKCNAAGIRFGYHNHAQEFEMIDGVVRFDYMLQNTDPEKVMYQLDLYWITVGGADPLVYFDKYPGRFELWHVKDEKELGGDETMMNFAPIFTGTEKSGMKNYIIEVERYSFSPLESVQKSIEFIKNAPYVTN